MQVLVFNEFGLN